MTSPPTPRVSVLLPCRDEEAHLPACIDSLRAQTDARFEALVLDDGSADDTLRLLGAWAERDPRVRPVARAGPGIVASLNALAAAARAPVLARMDADDVAHPERFASQLALLDRRPEIAACGTGVRYFPRDAVGSGYRRYEAWLNGLTDPGQIERDLFVECPIAHPTLMIRRSAFESLGGYRAGDYPEDYDLLLRLAATGGRMANVPRVLLDWRLGAGGTSRRSSRYSAEAFRRLKIGHLLGGVLPHRRPVVVWGAGSVGKAFVRSWRDTGGPEIEALVDLDPRKIGQTIHGSPVIDPAALARRLEGAGAADPGGRPFVLAAVGSPGARGEIRTALDAMGAVELADYRAVA